VRDAEASQLEGTPDVGPETACAIYEFFAQATNRRVLDRLVKAGVRVENADVADGDQTLSGKTIVFTGALETYTRDEAIDAVQRLGGQATSSVSSNTDYVVVGEAPGSKLDDARKEGVKILDEEEFERLIGG
jgi:DNA ligase (NAD+)